MLGVARVVIAVVVRWEGGDTGCVHLAHRSAVFDLFWIQLEMKLDWRIRGSAREIVVMHWKVCPHMKSDTVARLRHSQLPSTFGVKLESRLEIK